MYGIMFNILCIMYCEDCVLYECALGALQHSSFTLLSHSLSLRLGSDQELLCSSNKRCINMCVCSTVPFR